MEVKELMKRFYDEEKKLLNIIYGTIEVTPSSLKNSQKGKYFTSFLNDLNQIYLSKFTNFSFIKQNRFCY